MTTPTTVDEAIEQNALGPKRVQVGNQSVEQHSIADQILARDAEANETAKSRSDFGIRFTKIIPPGGG